MDVKMSECKADLDLYSVKARASAAGSVETGGACLLCQREFIGWGSGTWQMCNTGLGGCMLCKQVLGIFGALMH
jgi:hypothetical protein